MIYYFVRRVLMAIPVMFFVALFVFLMLRLTPGDPAQAIAGDQATPAQIAAIRQNLGLDEPLVGQFVTWIGNMAHGDFGVSLISQKPALEMIGQRIGPTLSLAVVAMLLTIVISLPLGVMAAWRHGGLIDRAVMSISVLGFSLPIFVIGYILIAIFAVHLKWFPVQGYKPITDGLGPFLYRIVLPGLALSSIYIALVSRMTRASMLEVLKEDYVRTARARGSRKSSFSFVMRYAMQQSRSSPLLAAALP